MFDFVGNYVCEGYHGCVRNEVVSLRERHIQVVPEFTDRSERIWAEAFELLRVDFPPRVLSRLSREDVIRLAPQSRRRRIRNAYANMDRNGWSDSYARISSFIKWEKFDGDADELVDKAPRLIQHRMDEFCYTLARFLKPVEKAVLYRRARGVRPFAKGMTPAQKAKRLTGMARFGDNCFVLLDHSRYDAHLVEGIRKHARRYFCDFYPGDRRLRHLLNLQQVNQCKTANGVTYTMQGTMCSGDYNTSLEDNIINYAILRLAFSSIDAEFLVDGDDSVVACSYSDFKSIDLDSFFERASLTTKIDVVFDLSEAEFCQSRLVRTSVGPIMVRHPNRVMSRSSYTIKTYQTSDVYRRLARAVAMSEMSCNRGVPILQSYSQMLLRSFSGVLELRSELEELLRHRRVSVNLESLPVSKEARLDFHIAFGISPGTQRSVEEYLDLATVDVLL